MNDAERRGRTLLPSISGACALTVSCGSFESDRASLQVPESRLSDASPFLYLFPPVQEPASNPGGSR